MKRTKDGYQLSTGRRVEANEGLLCPMDDGVLAEGHDGTVDGGWGDGEDCIEPALAPEERREIAEHMIARWQAWAVPSATREERYAALIAVHPWMGQLLHRDVAVRATWELECRSPEWDLTRALGRMLVALYESKNRILQAYANHLVRASPSIYSPEAASGEDLLAWATLIGVEPGADDEETRARIRQKLATPGNRRPG